MTDENLKRKLADLGFALFEREKPEDLNFIIAEVVKSGDLRLWEGFSVILANSCERGYFELMSVRNNLKNSEKAILNSLLALSLSLYKALRIKFSWTDKLLKSLDKKQVQELYRKILGGKELKISGYTFSPEKLKTVFKNYYGKTQNNLSELISMKEQLSLEYALSQIFSPKQKELFLKKIKGEKFTKTEREYFSRAVKKKVLALSNSELHNLAKKILQY